MTTVTSSLCVAPAQNSWTSASSASSTCCGVLPRCLFAQASSRSSVNSSLVRIHRLGDAVAEDDDQVAGLERDGFLLERRVLEQPEHDAAGLEAPDARRRDQQRRVVAGVAVGQRAVRAEHAVEAGQEPRLDRAPEQPVVQPRHQRRRAGLIRGLGAEHAQHRRGQQRRRRSLARHVADDEAEAAGRRDRRSRRSRRRPRGTRSTPRRSRRTRPRGSPPAAATAESPRRPSAPARTSPCRAPRDRAARSRWRAPLRPTASRAPTARAPTAARRARGCRDTARR